MEQAAAAEKEIAETENPVWQFCFTNPLGGNVMPIVNDNYISPTWQNNGPPALDQSEMQDISDTLEKNGIAIQALKEIVEKRNATSN